MVSHRARPSGRRRVVLTVAAVVPLGLAATVAAVAAPGTPRPDTVQAADAEQLEDAGVARVATITGGMAGEDQPEPVEAIAAPYVRDGTR